MKKAMAYDQLARMYDNAGDEILKLEKKNRELTVENAKLKTRLFHNLKIGIREAWDGWDHCDHNNCDQNPEYFDLSDRDINRNTGNLYKPYLKKGVLLAVLEFKHAGNSTLCRDCIDKVYKEFKTNLNTKLWIYK